MQRKVPGVVAKKHFMAMNGVCIWNQFMIEPKFKGGDKETSFIDESSKPALLYWNKEVKEFVSSLEFMTQRKFFTAHLQGTYSAAACWKSLWYNQWAPGGWPVSSYVRTFSNILASTNVGAKNLCDQMKVVHVETIPFVHQYKSGWLKEKSNKSQ